MGTNKDSSARLRRLREFLGLTQRELAKEFGVSYGAIGFWEQGERPIPGPILKLVELHEHHFISGPPEDGVNDENRELSSQWAHTIVARSQVRPSSRRRAIQTGIENVIQRYLAEGVSQEPVKRRVQLSVADRLIRSLGEAKGIPLKAAQLASYLDFNIPDELREALLTLQTQAEPMPAGRAARVLFDEFGKRPEQLFAQWSSKPFAAASIGQVHRARLFTGEEVAVKIQYPDLLPDMEADLDQFSFFHHLAVLLRGANVEIVEEFKESILRECDYLLEAENQAKIGAIFRGDPDILIPKVFPEFSGRRVLTTEFVKGLTFSEFLSQGTQAQKDKAGQSIVRFYTLSGFKHSLFQGDPNPGNYIFCGNQVAFIDFGRVTYWDEATRCGERDLCLAVLENDPKNGQRLLEELGLIQSLGQKDFEEFWEFFSAQHTPLTIDEPFQYTRSLIQQRIRMAKGFKKNPMTRVTRALFWDVFLAMSANAIRGDLGSTANWRRHLLGILKESGAQSRY